MEHKDFNILIIDDDRSTLKIVKFSLKNMGFTNITEEINGKRAYDLIQKEDSNFDLIISDLNMPEMTGLELLKEVRKSEKYRDIPFILLSTDGGTKTVTSAAMERVNSYLVKPITAANLEDKIKEVLKIK